MHACMFLRAHTHACMHGCMHACLYAHKHVYMDVRAWTYICMCKYTHVCMSTHVCIPTHARTYARMYSCAHTCMCRCTHLGPVHTSLWPRRAAGIFTPFQNPCWNCRFLSKSIIYSSFLSEFAQTLLFPENPHWNHLMFIKISNLHICFIKIINPSSDPAIHLGWVELWSAWGTNPNFSNIWSHTQPSIWMLYISLWQCSIRNIPMPQIILP